MSYFLSTDSPHSRIGGIVVWIALLLSIVAIAGATLGWLFYLPPVKVTTYLRVRPHAEESEQQYKILQATQIALFKSQFVLNAALARSDIAQLDSVVKHENPTEWLSRALEVSFPGEGEIMEVVLRGQESDISDYRDLLDAIVKSYSNEVIHKQRIRANELYESEAKVVNQLGEELVLKFERYSALRDEFRPEEDEMVASLVILEDEIEVLRELWKQKQAELRLSKIEQNTKLDRVRILHNATVDEYF